MAVLALTGIAVVGQLYAAIPLIPAFSRDWAVTPASATSMITAFAAAYACGALAAGRPLDRYGARAVLVAVTAAVACATAALAFATSLPAGVALRAVQGLAAGGFVPAAYAYLSASVTPRRLPLALTVLSCSLGGTVVVGQVLAQAGEATAGWRGFLGLAVVVQAIGALALGRTLAPAPALLTPSGPDSSGPDPGTPGRPERPWVAFRRLAPVLVAAATVAGAMTAVYTGVELHGPPRLTADPGALLALRASAFPALLAAVLLAAPTSRIPAPVRARGAFLLGAVGAALTAVLTGDLTGLGLGLLLMVFGLSLAGPALVHIAGTTAGRRTGGTLALYGFALNLGGAGGAALPRLPLGLSGLAWLLSGVLLAAAAIVGPLRRRRDAPAGDLT